MKLIEFKKHIESFPIGKIFNIGISKPFSWRGSYDRVTFSVIEKDMTREEILENIELAYSETFRGYSYKFRI
jgi:hypothetical protein